MPIVGAEQVLRDLPVAREPEFQNERFVIVALQKRRSRKQNAKCKTTYVNVLLHGGRCDWSRTINRQRSYSRQTIKNNSIKTETTQRRQVNSSSVCSIHTWCREYCRPSDCTSMRMRANAQQTWRIVVIFGSGRYCQYQTRKHNKSSHFSFV